MIARVRSEKGSRFDVKSEVIAVMESPVHKAVDRGGRQRLQESSELQRPPCCNDSAGQLENFKKLAKIAIYVFCQFLLFYGYLRFLYSEAGRRGRNPIFLCLESWNFSEFSALLRRGPLGSPKRVLGGGR